MAADREQSYPSPTSIPTTAPFYNQVVSAATADARSQASTDDWSHQLRQAATGATASPKGGRANLELQQQQQQQTTPPLRPRNGTDAYSDEDLQDSLVRDGLRDQTSQERVAQGVLSMSEPQAFGGGESADGQKAAGKRSKVSRACDECRRKKIRCDATTENPDEPCKNCKRSNSICRFSRQPMKRGPSKGYIKELADRLNTLESQIGPSGHAMYQGEPHYLASIPPDETAEQRIGAELQDYASPGGSSLARKRTISMTDSSLYGRESGPYQSPRTATASGSWTAESRQLPPPASVFAPPQTPASAEQTPLQRSAPPSNVASNLWRYGASDSSSRGSLGMSYEVENREVDASALPDWDEAVIEEYYRIIHPTFPLLPHSKQRLRSRLAACPPSLREAFFAALDCMIRTSPYANLPQTSPEALRSKTRRAAELISSAQYDIASSPRDSHNSQLVYLQTLVFMALESDNHPPVTRAGHFPIGSAQAEWLGRAIGVGMHLKLNGIPSKDILARGDPDGDEKLGRRLWWILFILDRWHASATSSPVQLQEEINVLVPEDAAGLGESTYHLVRLSFILGHLSAILQQSPSLMARDSPATPIISTTINGEIERFRESIEPLLSHPNLTNLAYWHVKLLVLRVTSAARPHQLLPPASRIATTLHPDRAPLTPLNHHFAALAALTLAELTDFDETRREAEAGLDDVLRTLELRRPSPGETEGEWDAAIRDLVGNRRRQLALEDPPANAEDGRSKQQQQGGLQHLADVAVSGNSEPAGTAAAATSNSTASPQISGAGLPRRTGESRETEGVASISATPSSSHPATSASPVFDPVALTRYGYLSALARDNGEGR